MGGFTLIGPNYRFSNRNLVKKHCRCLGFTSKISAETEKKLYDNESQCLEFDLLPDDLLEECQSAHLGDPLKYEIFYNVEYPKMNWNLHLLRQAQTDEIYDSSNNQSEMVKTPLGEIKENYIEKYLPEYSSYKMRYNDWMNAKSPIQIR